MRRFLKFSDAKLEAALRASGGDMAGAARALYAATGIRITRQAVHERVCHTPRLRKARDDAMEETIDLAETTVLQAIRAGDLNAARFVLETRGRHRGWTRRDPKVTAITDPSQLSDEQLDAALAALETIARANGLAIDATPALPGPVKRPHD